MTVRVKICGITRVEDAEATIAAGGDMIGLNFFAPSPRYLAIDRARVVREAIGVRAKVIGVFVNASRGYVEEHRSALSLDLLQFSGDEDDAMMRGWPIPVIAARRIKAGARAAASAADYVMLDAFDPKLYGGTGNRIALDDLRALDLSRTFVAGGLTPSNVAEVAALNPYAVDCASGVESSPGIKDHDKIRSFVVNVHNAKRAR